MFTLLLTSFPRLIKLFYFCRCPPFLCFSLILFLLLLQVGFKPNLTPWRGCLSFLLHVLICFIKSLEPSKMRLGRLFTYPLTKLLETHNGQINMVPFPLIASLVFVLYLRRSFKSMKGFCLFHEVYGKQLVFSSERVFMCILCASFSPFMGRFFNHPFS